MNTSFKIDLHLHSNQSDGSSTPIEIIDQAASKQMQVISITDHDTFTVTQELIDYAKSLNVELIEGIEMSCMDETTGRKVHILAYGFFKHHPHIDQLIDNKNGLSRADMLNYQLDKFNKVMQENLKRKGQKIVFIHGKGEGVLRAEIEKLLKKKYYKCTYQDASFQQYGFGATQVTIR